MMLMAETTDFNPTTIQTETGCYRGLRSSPKAPDPDPKDPIDQQLQALVLEAQRHLPQSSARRRALTQLVMAIEQSGRLDRLRKYAQSYSASAFEDLYHEAKQKMYFYICQKIELYRQEHPVMAWVNSTLNYKFLEAIKEQLKHPLDSLHPGFGPDVDQEYQALHLFLETDPEGLLAAHAIRNHPTITFQFLAIARHIQGQTWRELEEQTGISIQTLSCFFQRTLQKLLPYFSKYL